MYQNIKPLSPKAYQIFNVLADAARTSECQATDIDNAPGFMPVCIEIVLTISESEEHVSIAHYGQENGDLMRDPEIVFYHDRKEGKAYAMNYRNDYGGMYFAGVEETSILPDDSGRPWKTNQIRQKKHTEFAELWLKNIKKQQGLKL